MNEVVPTSMLPFAHITAAIQLRINAVNKGQAAKKGIALANFRSLLTNRLCKAVEALSRPHDNAPVLSVLRNDFKHLWRKVFRLIGAKPILHFINAGNNALYAILIADQQPPIIQLRALTLQGKVSDTLCPRVFLTPAERLLSHSDRFAVALPTSKNNAALITEELRITSKVIRYHLFWKIVKEVFPKGDFRNANMLTLFKSCAFPIGHKAINRTAQAEQSKERTGSGKRVFDERKKSLENINYNFQSSTPLHKRQRSPHGVQERNNNTQHPQGKGKATDGKHGIHRKEIKGSTKPLINGCGRNASIINTNFRHTV